MHRPASPESWLANRLDAQTLDWLHEQIRRIAVGWTTSDRDRLLAIAYAQVARRVQRLPIGAVPEPGLLAGWNACGWTLVDAARGFLLATLPAQDPEALVSALDNLAARADLAELVTVYRALPFLPCQDRWSERAAEGVRSNIRAVYEAIALDNPYPADHLDQGPWNQLVLKCFFLAAPSHRILGLDRRANPDLARMLTQYAHERWAASRPVPVGLWRCVALHADASMVADLGRVLQTGDDRERAAARLALDRCPHPEATALIAGVARPAQSWVDLETP